MPSINRHSIDKLVDIVKIAQEVNIPLVAIFPVIDNKNKTQKDVKQMDIQGKKELMQGEVNAKLMFSRDDVMNELLKDAKKAEEEIIDITQKIPQDDL